LRINRRRACSKKQNHFSKSPVLQIAIAVLIKILLKEVRDDLKTFFKKRQLPRGVLTGSFNFGFCPICETKTVFVVRQDWLRDFYHCARCGSIPRWRALIHVLQTHFPNWRTLKIHESSPGGNSSEKLKREGQDYLASHFFPDVVPGQMKHGFRCENLERQTFTNAEFDLVITQDVFEHILNPAQALSEIARALKPGGAHVFTIPWYYWKPTLVRAIEENGSIRHLENPDYHGNPIDPNGSLVVTEWGWDLCDFIYKHSGMTTTVVRIQDRYRGIEAEFIEVFISQKTFETGAASETEPVEL
jgi:hypothetical protein